MLKAALVWIWKVARNITSLTGNNLIGPKEARTAISPCGAEKRSLQPPLPCKSNGHMTNIVLNNKADVLSGNNQFRILVI